jgi:gliding motility-associated-like protein
MAKPSKILLLFLFGLLLSVGVDAGGSCTVCNQLIFKENKGQWNKNVLYKTEMHYANTFFEKTGITYELLDTADLVRYRGHHPFQVEYKVDLQSVIHGHAYKSIFLGADPEARKIGSEKLDEYFNYFIGKDKSKWATGVNAYRQVTYSNIYKGIDLDVYSEGTNLKYDWIIKANAYSSLSLPIQIKYEGADKVSLIDSKVKIQTSVGSVVESEPYAYQNINGKKVQVLCSYVMSDEGIVSFKFPDGWDHTHDLIIDPTLIFSTFSGSTADNFGYTATYDSKGNAYAAGSVFGVGYPITPGVFQISWAGGYVFPPTINFGIDQYGIDVGITKYNPGGTVRLFSTYLGGSADELPHSMVVNSNDELFVFGTTASSNFPVTANAYDTAFGGGPDPQPFYGLGVDYNTGSDIFITHFNQAGTALIGSTYVGGSANDGLNYPEYQDLHYQYADQVRGAIDVDANDNVYIASCTWSANFPVTPGAYQTTFSGVMDGVVFKMDNYLTTLIWSSFLGGNKKSACYSLALDNTGNVFVCGGTQSDSFPTTAGAFQPLTNGGQAEGFITLFNKNGNSIMSSTLFGTPSYDQLFFVQTDRQNHVYVLGETMDTSSFFSHNALYNIPKSGQYISKFSYDLDTLIWSTRFGTGAGRPDISPTAFLVDVCRSIYVAGWGSDFHDLYNQGPILSTNGMYVTSDAVQPTTDGNDFYVMVMKDDASAITYATYFGSNNREEHVDGGTSRFDKKGVIYESVCAGCGGYSTFPTAPANVVSHSNNSPNCNNAIFKLDLNLPLVIADFATPPSVCDTFNYQLVNTSKIIDTPNTIVYWNFGDGTTSLLLNPMHAYLSPGTYTITLIISDVTSCNGSDTARKQVNIRGNDSTTILSSVSACLGNSVQIGFNSVSDTSETYQWVPATGLNNINITNPYATLSQTTNYELVITKGNCHTIYIQQVVINKDSLIAKGANILCPYDTIQLFASDTAGQVLNYSWMPVSAVLSGGTTNSPFVKPPSSTTFYVTAVNPVTGCKYVDSINVHVISSLQSVQVTATPDTINYGDSSQLNTSYTQAASLYWDTAYTLTSSQIANPLAFPRVPTVYRVTVTDNNGCMVKKEVTVYIRYTPCASSNLYVPNAFSPNNDGKNDKLFVRGNFILDMYFTVYDRWGQKVFETRDQNNGWDGTYHGKKLDPAVFGWYIEGTCEPGEKFFKKGNVTLLR